LCLLCFCFYNHIASFHHHIFLCKSFILDLF
jgi:hypothetical protein